MVEGTISLYTRASRTRRAMSWAYCAPKSTTRTVSGAWADSGAGWRVGADATSGLSAVVRAGGGPATLAGGGAPGLTPSFYRGPSG